MAATVGLRPASAHYLSILQLVSSSSPNPLRQIDFESMEDIKDLERCVAGSTESSSETGYASRSSVASSFHTPLLRAASSPSASEFRVGALAAPASKRPSLCISNHTHSPNDAGSPSPNFPTRSSSLNALKGKPCTRSVLREGQSPTVSETTPVLSTPSTTSSIKTRHSIHGVDSYVRHQSLEVSRISSGSHRVKRISSMWMSRGVDNPMATENTEPEDHLRTEPRLSEEQKLIVLKRARKIAQVFGSEAPTELIQVSDHPSYPSASYRNSLSTISSDDIRPSLTARRRSSSVSSVTETWLNLPSPATAVDQVPNSASTSDMMAMEYEDSSSTSPDSPTADSASTTFRERRRRAAKLTQFFGVDYHDIPRSVSQAPPLPTRIVGHVKPESPLLPQPSTAEVNVKVAKQRLWGLVDDEMRSADVSDVINKLRVLKAA